MPRPDGAMSKPTQSDAPTSRVASLGDAAFELWHETFRPTAVEASPWLRGRVDAVDAPAQPDYVRSEVPGRHQILAFTEGMTHATQKSLAGGGDHYRDTLFRRGSLAVYSADINSEPLATRWNDPISFTSLSIDDAAFASVAEAADIDLAGVEFLDRFPPPDSLATDDVLFALVVALRDELLSEQALAAGHTVDPAGRVYAEALIQAAAAHVLRHHTARGLTPEAFTGGLTRRHVAQATDYARAHLAADVSLADLAAAADLSPYHFAREFKRSTGETAHGMLRRLRMETAATLLRATPHSVASVALDVGYASPSRFAAAFRKHTGVSPTVFRRDR